MGGLALKFSTRCLALMLFSALLLGFIASAEDAASSAGFLSVNGTKFLDIDGDGARDSDEAVLSGWKILLQRDGLEISNTTTDQDGGYRFSDLAPGNYTISEEAQAGWNITVPGGGSYQVTLTDQSSHGLDFGNRRAEPAVYSPQESDYPVMRPTEEEMKRWLSRFNATPKMAAVSSQQIAAMISTMPASYSLLKYLEYTPSERNQGSCGNCWAWAGTGVLEVDMASKKGLVDRLSLQYLSSNYQSGFGKNWACCGGWLADLADFYSTQKMAIPWSNSNAQWQDGRKICESSTSVSPNLISTNPRYSLSSVTVETIPTQQVGSEAAIANIKNVLLSDRAIWFAYFLPTDSAWSDFKYFWGSEPESSVWRPDYCGEYFVFGPCPNAGGGHAVLCVGYDETDPNDRSWLMLNSWGSSGLRPGGLFRLSMDMDYSCSYPNVGYAYYWQTLKVSYPSNTAPSRPVLPQGATRCYQNDGHSYTTLAFDPEGDQIRFTFDWGDRSAQNTTGPVDSGSYCSSWHVWKTAGNYTVKVRATDSKGLNSEWSEGLAVMVTDAGINLPPDRPITPSGPSSGGVGMEYRFSSAAVDPENEPLTLTFDWGDNSSNSTQEVSSGTQVQASHIWSSPATYPVRVRATDRRGAVSEWSATKNFTVSANKNPMAPTVPFGPTAGFTDATLTFNSSASDPDGDTVKIIFFWGDGQSTETGMVPSGYRVQASHIWTSPGSYQIRAQAVDSRGGYSGLSRTKTIKINRNSSPATPRVLEGSGQAFVNATASFAVTTKDPERDRVRYSIRWGDGNTSTTHLATSGSRVVVHHRWKEAGTYAVQVRATDIKGAASDWSVPISVVVTSGAQQYQNGSQQSKSASIHVVLGNQTDLNETIDEAWENQTTANRTFADQAPANRTQPESPIGRSPVQVGGNDTDVIVDPSISAIGQTGGAPAGEVSGSRTTGVGEQEQSVHYLKVSMGR
ncbi:MAG: PKD domain protein [Methanosaeta sp. PtaB.Bin039]|nr:MAG: PKD domain protein [Methanosaeta sp. PtaB.Bin039]HQF15527.1 PKD domain-containing protein [Methanotrichaceae archaeon]HQI90262.1 PKD domain-containing protein [Methanotrichaceae archaeon]HQJ27769.1 PKD domain-containing protein [Methanotrichaceae archaeon]